ncbi:MerR family transcriptional regulator [Streptomyces sp. 8L]|uniref:MerR family transcriptional regulator n=1 Tax=Streptomyces sp. 8L TaxID=2877242 RepID=UPI001CD45408|nr:MerR family transcriptional regulator [Streptomyces sp. 8L]MCA1221208.1 MerR family transcriptional regulator [Streptomyces sp. 8L]
MKIGEAAKASGLSVRTLRFYEDEGLCVPPRAHNGYREYCEWGLQRIQVIRTLLDSGLSIKLIKEVLHHLTDRPAGPDEISPAFLGEVTRYRDRLAQRVALLAAQQEALDTFLEAARNEFSPLPQG